MAYTTYKDLELSSRPDTHIEGFVDDDQVRFLQNVLLDNFGSKSVHVLEIGFNRGHSAAAFLSASSNCNVTSVDVGTHSYVSGAKELVDQLFPGRHRLVIGDSAFILPTLKLDSRPDIVFIDGSHRRPRPWLDLTYCAKLVNNGCFVVVDDYCPIYGSEGVIEAWDNVVAKGLITQLGTQRWGERGVAFGRYKA